MTNKPSPSPQMAAVLTKFTVARSPILYGEKLKEVRCLERSIEKFGLLTPLVVVKKGHALMVIDGKKRFAALRRMVAKGTLPRDLNKIPYILINENKAVPQSAPTKLPQLLDNRDQYRQVQKLHKSGHSLMDIATQLYMSKTCIKEILSVTRLSPRLKLAYFAGHLSRSQAKAFATLASHEDQEALIIKLGPFAQEADILRAIETRQTLIAVDPDNIIILPKACPTRRIRAAA